MATRVISNFGRRGERERETESGLFDGLRDLDVMQGEDDEEVGK